MYITVLSACLFIAVLRLYNAFIAWSKKLFRLLSAISLGSLSAIWLLYRAIDVSYLNVWNATDKAIPRVRTTYTSCSRRIAHLTRAGKPWYSSIQLTSAAILDRSHNWWESGIGWRCSCGCLVHDSTAIAWITAHKNMWLWSSQWFVATARRQCQRFIGTKELHQFYIQEIPCIFLSWLFPLQ